MKKILKEAELRRIVYNILKEEINSENHDIELLTNYLNESADAEKYLAELENEELKNKIIGALEEIFNLIINTYPEVEGRLQYI